jgi:broad specificity phosphatase PhoE
VTVLLIRHASAGDRNAWQGDDRRRPLDKKGRKQAQRLVEALADHEIDRVLSSPYDRCVQTVEPLARARGLEIELREELSDEQQLDAGVELVRSLRGENAAIGVHGGLSDVLVGVTQRKGETFVLGENGRLEDAIRV